MKVLGSSHSDSVLANYHSLLGLDKRFLASEPSWDNLVYVSNMILIHAASKGQSLPDKPYFFDKHFIYLKDKFKDYFEQDQSE